MTRTYAFTVDGGRVRLDRFLGEALREQDVSREKVKRAIRDGGCLVDGAVCTDVSAKVGAGQSIELRMEAEPTSVQPEEGELEILYQDAWLAVLNKPAGMTVHPAPSCPDGTLVHRLVARFPSLRRRKASGPASCTVGQGHLRAYLRGAHGRGEDAAFRGVRGTGNTEGIPCAGAGRPRAGGHGGCAARQASHGEGQGCGGEKRQGSPQRVARAAPRGRATACLGYGFSRAARIRSVCIWRM